MGFFYVVQARAESQSIYIYIDIDKHAGDDGRCRAGNRALPDGGGDAVVMGHDARGWAYSQPVQRG